METIDTIDTIDSVMGNFITPGNVSKYQYDKLTKLQYKHYNFLIKLLCNMDSITDNKKYINMFSIYKIGVLNDTASHELDIECDVGENFYGTLQTDGNNIYFHNYHPMIMGNYVNDNKLLRYLFFPFVASVEVKNESGHALCIVIDTKLNEMYLMDPNGKTSYYDDVLIRFSKSISDLHIPDEFIREMYIDSSSKINKLMSCYVDDLNKYLDTKLRFVPNTEWNVMGKALNRKLGDGVIQSGNCVAMTIFLMHYLTLTQSSLKSVYSAILKYSDTELSHIIDSYSLSIYNLLNSM